MTKAARTGLKGLTVVMRIKHVLGRVVTTCSPAKLWTTHALKFPPQTLEAEFSARERESMLEVSWRGSYVRIFWRTYLYGRERIISQKALSFRRRRFVRCVNILLPCTYRLYARSCLNTRGMWFSVHQERAKRRRARIVANSRLHGKVTRVRTN